MYLRGEGFQGFDGLEVIGYWVGTALDIGPVHAKSPTIVVVLARSSLNMISDFDDHKVNQ